MNVKKKLFLIILTIINVCGLLTPHLVTSTPVKSQPRGNLMVKLPSSQPGASKETQQKEFPKKIKELQKIYGAQLDVPEKPLRAFRIATYNVHNWRGPDQPFNSPHINFDNQFDAITRADPTVIILQEVHNDERYKKKFRQAGYKYISFVGATKKSSFGNMILSKLPLIHIKKKTFDRIGKQPHGRAFIRAEIDLTAGGTNRLVIYGTHFDDKDLDMRCAEASELIQHANREDKNKHVLIAADFNSRRGSPPLQCIEDNGFVDNFTAAGVTPGSTHWSGQTIDYLYLRKNDTKDLTVADTSIVYNAASDHLPVVVDLVPQRQ